MAQFKLRPQLSARNGVIAAVVLIVGTWLAVAATRTPGVDKLGEPEATQGPPRRRPVLPDAKAMGVIDDDTGHRSRFPHRTFD